MTGTVQVDTEDGDALDVYEGEPDELLPKSDEEGNQDDGEDD